MGDSASPPGVLCALCGKDDWKHLIVLFVATAPHLYSSYFLVVNLSFIDLEACSVTSLKMIYDLLESIKSSLLKVALLKSSSSSGGAEMVFLFAMAFDRYGLNVSLFTP